MSCPYDDCHDFADECDPEFAYRCESCDGVGHYCKTKNCQWQHGYSTCPVTAERKKKPKEPPCQPK